MRSNFFYRSLNHAFFCFLFVDILSCSTAQNSEPTDSSVGDTRSLDVSLDTSEVQRIPDAQPDSSSLLKCNAHAGDECDLVRQNCPDRTPSCMYDTQKKHTVCAAVSAGTVPKGKSCSASNPCADGLFCIDDVCSPACCLGDNSVCGVTGDCSTPIFDSNTMELFYSVCNYAPGCSLFRYNCAPNAVCLPAGPYTFRCAPPYVGTPLSQAPGRDCTFNRQCGESQICLPTSTAATDAGVSDADGSVRDAMAENKDAEAGVSDSATSSQSKCFLLCDLSKSNVGPINPASCADGGTGLPDAESGGRFPANGTCGCYGTCKESLNLALPLGIGVCVK